MSSLKKENELLKRENIFLKKEISILKNKLEKIKSNENTSHSSMNKKKSSQKENQTEHLNIIEGSNKKEQNNQKQFKPKFNQIGNKTIESEKKYKETINELTTTNKNLTNKIFQLRKIITVKDKKISDLKNEINKIIKQATSEIKQLNNQLTKFECSLHATNSQRDKKCENKSKIIIDKNFFFNKKNTILNSSETGQFLNNKENKNNLQNKGLQFSYKIKNVKYHDKNTITPKTHRYDKNSNVVIKHFDSVDLYKKHTYLLSNLRNKNMINRYNKTVDFSTGEINGIISDSSIKIKNINYFRDKTSSSDYRNQVMKSSPQTFQSTFNNFPLTDGYINIENGNSKIYESENNLIGYRNKMEKLKKKYQNSYQLEGNSIKQKYANILNENSNLKNFSKDNINSGSISEKKKFNTEHNKILINDFNRRLKGRQIFGKFNNIDKFLKEKILFPNEEANRNEYVNLELQKINEQEKKNYQSLSNKEI